MEELKICPFCGRKSVTIIRSPTSFGALYYKVACANCLVNTSLYAYEKRAIEVWNRREQIVNQNTDIQKLKSFIAEQKKIADAARNKQHYGLETPDDLGKKAWWTGVHDTLNMISLEIEEIEEGETNGNRT